MCGGHILQLPCSHVAHVFRSFSPYTSHPDLLFRNLARVAEVVVLVVVVVDVVVAVVVVAVVVVVDVVVAVVVVAVVVVAVVAVAVDFCVEKHMTNNMTSCWQGLDG